MLQNVNIMYELTLYIYYFHYSPITQIRPVFHVFFCVLQNIFIAKKFKNFKFT